MTAEPDLLPCPWCGEKLASVSVSEGSTFRWRKVDGCCADGPEVRHNTMAEDQEAAEVESRAAAIAAWNTRANVAHATAAKDAEVEALRAEVERAHSWNERVSVCPDHVTDIVDGPCVICALDAAEARADKLRAEVERLTFEMERLQQQYDERTACMIVHRGSALACSDAVRAAYSDEHHRAERLAEALRHQRWCRTCAEDGWESCEDGRKADALLNPAAAQENDDA